MREILFRAKLKDDHFNKGWQYGLVYCTWFSCNIFRYWLTPVKKEDLTTADTVCVNSETICEYTGLTDNNGVKIFEGDICDISQFDSKGDEERIRCEVVYHSSSFWLSSIKDDRMFSFAYLPIPETAIEIVGNVFDNPELLEKGAKT